jgi:hypothetical protein
MIRSGPTLPIISSFWRASRPALAPSKLAALVAALRRPQGATGLQMMLPVAGRFP